MCTMRVVFMVVAVYAIVLVSAAPAKGKGNPARAMAMFNACKEQTKVTQADLEILEKKEIPSTRTGKCFMGCMMERGRIINNGKYNKARAMQIAKKVFGTNQTNLQQALAVIDMCDKQVSGLSDKCEVAAKLAQCMKENNLADKRKEQEAATAAAADDDDDKTT